MKRYRKRQQKVTIKEIYRDRSNSISHHTIIIIILFEKMSCIKIVYPQINLSNIEWSIMRFSSNYKNEYLLKEYK